MKCGAYLVFHPQNPALQDTLHAPDAFQTNGVLQSTATRTGSQDMGERENIQKAHSLTPHITAAPSILRMREKLQARRPEPLVPGVACPYKCRL